MRSAGISQSLRDTGITLAFGAVGGAIGWLIGAPVYLLLGPAVMVSLAGLMGVRTVISPMLRDACFVLLGLAVGAGFDREALGAMIRWPLAFAALVVLVWFIMAASRAILSRRFGFDRRSALLASAPGHLSFVITMASDTGADVARISVTQSVRLLSLTLVVPFVAMGLGVDLGGSIAPAGTPLHLLAVACLVVGAVVLGQAFRRFAIPAPLLMGAMVISAFGHLTLVTEGVMPATLILPAYLVLGALIGTRFSGVTPAQCLSALWAGLAITGVAVLASCVAALPIALALGMPLAHVLVAFAPGGLETMIALGAVLGVIPGFVAACHITRLFALSALLPLMISQERH